MKEKISRFSLAALALLLLANLVAGPRVGIAQGNTIALSPSTSATGEPACWMAVGNKLYYVVKDDSTILKVKASASL